MMVFDSDLCMRVIQSKGLNTCILTFVGEKESLLLENYFSLKIIAMKKYLLPFLIILLILGCSDPQERNSDSTSLPPELWMERKVDIPVKDALEYGKSYLSIYSQIYSPSQRTTHNLTAMVSLRNTSDQDTIYILKAVYFDSHGKPIRSYFDQPIYLTPLETKEIIIKRNDVEGGTGSNFIFEWKIPKNCPEPLFEGVMNSTVGQQGLSFSTQSIRIK